MDFGRPREDLPAFAIFQGFTLGYFRSLPPKVSSQISFPVPLIRCLRCDDRAGLATDANSCGTAS